MSEKQSALEASYLATTYRINTPVGIIDIRIGHKQPELDALLLELRATEWAFISAWNPGSRPTRSDRNASAHAKLLEMVRDRGLVFYEGDGISDAGNWVTERSIWLAGIGRQEAIEIGRRFGQNALVVGSLYGVAELVDCRS